MLYQRPFFLTYLKIYFVVDFREQIWGIKLILHIIFFSFGDLYIGWICRHCVLERVSVAHGYWLPSFIRAIFPWHWGLFKFYSPSRIYLNYPSENGFPAFHVLGILPSVDYFFEPASVSFPAALFIASNLLPSCNTFWLHSSAIYFSLPHRYVSALLFLFCLFFYPLYLPSNIYRYFSVL